MDSFNKLLSLTLFRGCTAMCLLGLGGAAVGGLQLDSVEAFEICDVFIEPNISWLLPKPKGMPLAIMLSTGTILKFSCALIAAAGASVSKGSAASREPINDCCCCSSTEALALELLASASECECECACSCAARALLTFSDMALADGLHGFCHLQCITNKRFISNDKSASWQQIEIYIYRGYHTFHSRLVRLKIPYLYGIRISIFSAPI